MEDALIRYGLWAVFLGATLEGDVSVILAGVLAHLGFFSLPGAIVTGACGGIVADVACYVIGRTHAAAIRDSAIYRRVGPFVERLAQRIGPGEVALARFLYGTRVASMLVWGMYALPVVRFAVLDVIGCTLWSIVLSSLGFVTSSSAAMLIGKFKRAERWLLVSVLLATGAVIASHRLARRLRR
jgi:membrane protein DedA with SNARE-associated domain